MADTILSYCGDRITINPNVCNGKPTLRNKRITVQTVLEFLSAGETTDEILRQYPSLELGGRVSGLPAICRPSDGTTLRLSGFCRGNQI